MTASIGVTLGLMLLLVGVASVIWKPDIARNVPTFSRRTTSCAWRR